MSIFFYYKNDFFILSLMYSLLPGSGAALTLAKQVPDQNTVFLKKSAKLADPGRICARTAPGTLRGD